MRPLRYIAVVLVAGAASLTAPAVASANTTEYCGSSAGSGLAVFAVSAQDKATACDTAMRVAAAGYQEWQKSQQDVITVYVDGVAWQCRERQGDPNPYQQCVNQSRPSEMVNLSS